MLINFCLEQLCKIACEQPCAEGYNVGNLISLNINRNKGFLAEYFVKPPVNITIDFICPINIKIVIIKSEVGAQKSKIFRLLSKKKDETRVIAFAVLDPNEKNLFIQHCDAKEKCTLQQVKYDRFFPTNYTSNVSRVTVRVLKTESSSLAAIGGLELWGSLPSNTPPTITEFIMKVWRSINLRNIKFTLNTSEGKNPVFDIVSCDPQSNEPVFKNSYKASKIPEDFHIPEDFIDPLSCELMTLPMLLPSGKIVDISTLEKFYKVEEEYGRGPSDPFTFLVFTDQRKPIVATGLKHRLDKFLLENSHIDQLKNVPRTVGRKPFSCQELEQSESASASTSKPNISEPNSSKRKNIDDLMKSALLGFPSFLDKPKVRKIDSVCCFCTSNEMIYRMFCQHIVCRKCLIKVKENKLKKACNNCNMEIDFQKLLRLHLSS